MFQWVKLRCSTLCEGLGTVLHLLLMWLTGAIGAGLQRRYVTCVASHHVKPMPDEMSIWMVLCNCVNQHFCHKQEKVTSWLVHYENLLEMWHIGVIVKYFSNQNSSLSCLHNVTVTIIVSSRIDHFTPLMILHSIQSNSTACSNSMNCNCPQFGSPLNSKSHAVLYISGNLGSKLINEISHCAIVSATFQEIFFSKLLTKFRKLFLKVKLSREVHEWCTSRGPWTSFNFV